MSKIYIYKKNKLNNKIDYLCTYGNNENKTLKSHINNLINKPKDKTGFSSEYMYNNLYLNGDLKIVNSRKFENDKYIFTVSFK